MIKKHFQKEIRFDKNIKKGDKGKKVKLVQEWLNLWRYLEPSWMNIITIDGDYGPQTRTAVGGFQKLHQVSETGIVNQATWDLLVSPMSNAFNELHQTTLRELIVSYALQHLINVPRELNNRNEGPWVRAYMDGLDGTPWAWCMGFAQTIYDQAFSGFDQKFTSQMPHTYSCDVVGFFGRDNGKLIRNRKLRDGAHTEVKPGDMFLVVKNPRDWIHTGIIIDRQGDWFHTVEGNTNDEGVREGFEVCRRMRNFRTHNIDVFQLDV